MPRCAPPTRSRPAGEAVPRGALTRNRLSFVLPRRPRSVTVGVELTPHSAGTPQHLDLGPPEKPPPEIYDVVRVPVDDEGREIESQPA